MSCQIGKPPAVGVFGYCTRADSMYTKNMNNNDTAPAFTLYTEGDGGFPHVVSEHATAAAAVEAGTRLSARFPAAALWVLDPDTDVVWES